ncbi:MAG: hypothetical protein ACOC6F_02600 [bacterium]
MLCVRVRARPLQVNESSTVKSKRSIFQTSTDEKKYVELFILLERRSELLTQRLIEWRARLAKPGVATFVHQGAVLLYGFR